MSERWKLYWRLMRFDRPIGIWLLLWPTLWALWLAAGRSPPLHVLIVFVVGTVLMRAAGCVINDYADRGFDPHVERTRNRPIATGQVSPREALTLFAVLCLTALALVLTLRNERVVLLAIPAVIVAAAYPFMKRWISLPQAVLGLAFSWGIPMAYAAIQPVLPWREVLALMAANLLWVIAYDTYYAMADRADDLKIGVKSSAILFGRADRPIILSLQFIALFLLAAIGGHHELGGAYYAGLTTAAAVAIHQFGYTRSREPGPCFRAFLQNNLFGGFVFLGLLLDHMQ